MQYHQGIAWRQLKAWSALSRISFHPVGWLPFLLGHFLTFKYFSRFRWDILGVSLLALVLILIAVHYISEYFDYPEDAISFKLHHSKFSGGSRVLVSGLLPADSAWIAGLIVLGAAIICGVFIVFVFKPGWLAIPLGVCGLISGLFYSAPPLRWVNRGLGELFVFFAYGWLTVASGFYLQAGALNPVIIRFSLPLAFSVVTVVIINEFADYEADRACGKRNLLVRFGKEWGAKLYLAFLLAAWLVFFVLWFSRFNAVLFILSLPILAVAIYAAKKVVSGVYKDTAELEKVCLATILANLGMNILLFGFAVYL